MTFSIKRRSSPLYNNTLQTTNQSLQVMVSVRYAQGREKVWHHNMPCVAMEFDPPPWVVHDFCLVYPCGWSWDMPYLHFTALRGFRITSRSVLGQPWLYCRYFHFFPLPPFASYFLSFIYHGGLVYFCGIARSAFGCGIINLDLNDIGAALGRIWSHGQKNCGKAFSWSSQWGFNYFSRVHLSRLGLMAVFVWLWKTFA